MNVGTIVRPSDGRLALIAGDPRVAELKAQRFPVEGLEWDLGGWGGRTLARLNVCGEWGPAAAWQEAE